MENISAIVLAAGKGTRMKSKLPKVLHPLAGKPMLAYVLAAVEGAGIPAGRLVLVIGHEAGAIRAAMGEGCHYVLQEEQLGTGHAVLLARQSLPARGDTVMVVCGDTPLLRAETLAGLWRRHREAGAAASVLTAVLDNPAGYGRVVRDGRDGLAKIVEEKDASPAEKAIAEINAGTYCFDGAALDAALERLSPANAQGEFYLTDVVEIMVRSGLLVQAVQVDHAEEIQGINNRVQLAAMARVFRERINTELMLAGVTIVDPAATYIDAGVRVEADTVIYPGTILRGQTVIGPDSVVGPLTTVENCVLGRGVVVQNSVLQESKVGDGCVIGPYAYLRPGTVLAEGVKVGDFVELKQTSVGRASKVPHLTYLGDCQVGEEVNVGAGTITCNYDGREKWPTIIGDHVFVGSNSNLVAPVRLGDGAFIAAGSTVTRDVPPGAMAVARGRQVNKEDWAKNSGQAGD